MISSYSVSVTTTRIALATGPGCFRVDKGSGNNNYYIGGSDVNTSNGLQFKLSTENKYQDFYLDCDDILYIIADTGTADFRVLKLAEGSTLSVN